MDFRIVDEDEIPHNLEKDWDYWYVVDLDKDRVTVKAKKAVTCPPENPEDYGAKVVCGSRTVEEFRGTIDEFLKYAKSFSVLERKTAPQPPANPRKDIDILLKILEMEKAKKKRRKYRR